MPRVEVVYALAQRQQVIELELPRGATVQDALERSGIAAAGLKTGIFGKPCTTAARLREGDRVELYRPLLADPKQARRQRARRRR